MHHDVGLGFLSREQRQTTWLPGRGRLAGLPSNPFPGSPQPSSCGRAVSSVLFSCMCECVCDAEGEEGEGEGEREKERGQGGVWPAD